MVLMPMLGQDIRFAVRGLIRRPGFATAAVVTLALGIGASTAIFSVAYGVSLRPLAYPEPDRLIRIYEAHPVDNQLEQDVSVGAFQAWREGASSLEHAALYSPSRNWTMAEGSERRPVRAMNVTPGFFDVLGVRPLLGPGFKPEREYTRFTTKEVVLSYDAWHRLFGASPDVIDTTLTEVGGTSDDTYRIVGVMPEAFAFLEPIDVWWPQVVEVPVSRMLHGWRYDRVIARLAPGAELGQARAELETAAARLAAAVPTTNSGWTVTVKTLHESVVGDFGRVTWVLVAAVAVVLVVACLNVGGLLVARAVTRERETALRLALGAGAWRVARLWLAEATLLASAGAVLGLGLAWLGLSVLVAAAPPWIPRLDSIAIDVPTLGVATVATLFAVGVFTAAPFGRKGRHRLAEGLRTGSAGSGVDRRRATTRAAITVAQCAGAATLVLLAVLLVRSFDKLTAVDLGWDPAGILSVSADPPMPRALRRPWYRRVEWSDRLIARLEATPNIEGAAITTQLPLGPEAYVSTLARGRGRPTSAEDLRWPGVMQKVTDRYFDVMTIRLIEGRTFGQGDRFAENHVNGPDYAERGVAVVSESTAEELWPDQSAIGQALWLPDIDNVTWREVVGVVEDIQFHAIGETPALHVFVPWTQTSSGAINLVVKPRGSAIAVAPAVRSVIEAVEPGTTVDRVAPLQALVDRATAQPRFTSRLVAAFGTLALALAVVGLYGTLAYLVSRQTREIGIRIALGAAPSRIRREVVGVALKPVVLGLVIGLTLAAAATGTFQALLFGVEPLDPISYTATGFILMLAAVAAALLPAVRAARIEPGVALRSE